MKINKLHAILICTTLSLMMTATVANTAEKNITLNAKSSQLNLATGDTQFNKDIVINNGILKILAATLSQKSDKQNDQEKMELTGKPAKITLTSETENVITHILANNIVFYPKLGILQLSGKTKLKIKADGKDKTQISGNVISIKFNSKTIETIHAEGNPLQYQFNPDNGKTLIHATAKELALNNTSGDVELYQAIVKQGEGELRAGKIVVDGETGNLSANTGQNQSRPSFSIDLDKIKQQEKQP